MKGYEGPPLLPILPLSYPFLPFPVLQTSLTGQTPHLATRAVHTSAPSSMIP